MNPKPTTAILIFSRSAQEEARVKEYCRQEANSEKIARQLILHTERVARLSGIPVIKKYGNAQSGHFFKNRITNAIQEVFDLGYSKVIALGTDSPGIHVGILKKIARLLETNNIVVGPSLDGGFYALGLSKAAWDKKAFQQIPWQTNAVQHSVSCYAASFNCTELILQQLQDIDDKQSFFFWLSSEKKLSLLRIIRAIISLIKRNSESGIITITYFCSRSIHRRGPPIAA